MHQSPVSGPPTDPKALVYRLPFPDIALMAGASRMMNRCPQVALQDLGRRWEGVSGVRKSWSCVDRVHNEMSGSVDQVARACFQSQTRHPGSHQLQRIKLFVWKIPSQDTGKSHRHPSTECGRNQQLKTFLFSNSETLSIASLKGE